MLFFPRPYPDEVVGSLILRACRHTGVPYKRLVRQVTGERTGSCSFLLPSQLRRLSELTGVESDQLLWEHTMFPYIVAFMNPLQVIRFIDKMLGADERKANQASLTKTVTHGVANRRFCPCCVQEDIAAYGEAYWHRSHLLPGAHVCIEHQCPLMETQIPISKAAGIRYLAMPNEVRGFHCRTMLDMQVLKNLSWRSIACLRRNAFEARLQEMDFREAALSRGYAIAGGNVASAQLADDVLQFYGKKFLEEAGCSFANKPQTPWPAILVRPRIASVYATPKHVLLATYLDFAGQTRKRRTYRRPGKKLRDYPEEDRKCLRSMGAVLRRVAAAGNRITVKELLMKAGFWSHFRHHRQEYPRSAAFLTAFQATDLSERQVGRRPCWRKRLGLDRRP